MQPSDSQNTATFTISVSFEREKTDAEAIAVLLDRLLEFALSLIGEDTVEEDYGKLSFGEFFVKT